MNGQDRPGDPITSVSNPQIIDLVRLRDRRHRDRTETFAIEGFREIRRAIDAGIHLQKLYVCPSLFLGPNEDALVADARTSGAEIVQTAETPFRKASYRDRPEGLLATAVQFDTSIGLLDRRNADLILIVESIEKPGNLGTMLRTADAVGASVIVCDQATDVFNPNVVRASLGTLFTVRPTVASSVDVIRYLDTTRMVTVATTPDGSSLLYDIDLTVPTAIAIGSEQYGLSNEWLLAADHRVRLPMIGSADSLNAAIAAAVSLYEVIRQRLGGREPDSGKTTA